MSGTGLVVARPATGATLWRALRAEIGATAALRHDLAVELRAGIAVPLTRPRFVLDGSEVVYQPRRLAARLVAGTELGF